jgi:hypothetical protein
MGVSEMEKGSSPILELKGNKVIIDRQSFRKLLIYFERQKKLTKLGTSKVWDDMQKEIDTYVEQCKSILNDKS